MKMTMSTSSTMTARVHRKVMRAPHKRSQLGKILNHPGKMANHPGIMTNHAGKMINHAEKMVNRPGKMAHHVVRTVNHPGKPTHLGKFGKLAHYAHSTHSLRPPEPCESSNDSGLGPDHDHRHSVNRLSDAAEKWELEAKRQRCDSGVGTVVKLECDDANDAITFTTPAPSAISSPIMPAITATITAAIAHQSMATPIPPQYEPPPPAMLEHTSVIRAGCSADVVPESQGKRIQDTGYRSCGKLGSGKLNCSGKLVNRYPGGGKLCGGGKLGGKLGGKYGGKLAQALARRRALAAMHSGPAALAASFSHRSRDGAVELQILCQPESQHRARYQTEGSRGAVKDNSGNGFPIVKLVGYDKPAVLQVFIGTDTGRVAPHMFYQACRVSGKNSTPCKERKEDGTVVIEIELEPTRNWQVTCDCVGILKERNVDVEHRFGESLAGGPAGAHLSRGKKKSTRCRMVFRTEIVNSAGQLETLQVCSTQIVCTQPPGVPEVCRKSLVSCPATGGLELYLIGKNFLKETRVVFSHRTETACWEEEVVPDKEFLQQTHLVCCVPPYQRTDITENIAVQLFVRSGGKASESHTFHFTPPNLDTGPLHATKHHAQGEDARPVMLWGGAMLPPPAPPRRPSLILPDAASPLSLSLKAEMQDDSNSMPEHPDANKSCQSSDSGTPDTPPQGLVADDLKVVDLRLKSETNFVGGYDGIKMSPSARSDSQSPLASFTQQLQAMQNQVQTDKMVETVTAAIFTDDGGQMYVDQPMMPMTTMSHLISAKTASMPAEMKTLDMNDRRMIPYDYDKLPPPPPPGLDFDPFGPITKMEVETMERRIAEQAQMEALVEDAMKVTSAMLPTDAKLDELVNSRADDHLSGNSSSPPTAAMLSPGAVPNLLLAPAVPNALLCEPPQLPPPQEEIMILGEQVPIPTSVKTPPAAVKSMILNAAAEILTSDSTMNALVTSAINTANILTTESAGPQDAQPPAEPAVDSSVMSQAVSHAVTQAVSQAVSHAVSQAVSQEMTAPVQRLTDMSDNDLLSYINPSTFDQGMYTDHYGNDHYV